MTKTIIGIEFIGPWRRPQALPIVAFTMALSAVAAIIPLRLSSEIALRSESFLAAQLLMCLLFVLVVTVRELTPTRFKWNAEKIGPLGMASERLVFAQFLGQVLALLTAWATLLALQVSLLPYLTGIGLGGAFVGRSIVVVLAGIGLVAWGQLLAVLLPLTTAMLGTVGIVVIGHFILVSGREQGHGLVSALSPGIELLLASSQDLPSPRGWMSIVGLIVGLLGISNLLSAWLLEAWHGALCPLDQGQTRS